MWARVSSAVTGLGKKLAALVICVALPAACVLSMETGSHIRNDRAVLVHPIVGFYATATCVAGGAVSHSYVENPREMMMADPPPIRGEPLVELTTYADAVGRRALNGAKLKPDPQCDGFVEWKPLWRRLIGW